jgi:hypothetical protein
LSFRSNHVFTYSSTGIIGLFFLPLRLPRPTKEPGAGLPR